MCAAIAVRGPELFTSSSFPHARSALAPHFLTAPFSPCLPNFLSVPLFFPSPPFPSQSYPCMPLNSLRLHLPLAPCLSSPPSSRSFPLSLSPLYPSPVLSALRQVSAITPLHLLIPLLIQPGTHSCLTSLGTVLTHSPADCTNAPEDARSPVCPHTRTRLLCRKMPFVKGQGASISELHQPAV